MDVRQIRYFCAIVEQGSISRAANAMFITQPALSKSLQKLEEELGVALFDRRKKALTLNEMGENAYRHFSAILANLDALHSDLQKYKQSAEKVTVYNTVMLFSDFMLPEYEMRYPNRIICSNHPEADISTDILISRQAALLLTIEPIRASDVVCHQIFKDQLLVRVPNDYHIGSNGKISIDELRNAPLLFATMNPSAMRCIKELLRQHGITVPDEGTLSQMRQYNQRFQLYQIQQTRSFCFTTDTVSSYLEVPDYRLLEIDSPDAYLHYYAAYLKQDALLVAPLLDWLRQRAVAATQQRRAGQTALS